MKKRRNFLLLLLLPAFVKMLAFPQSAEVSQSSKVEVIYSNLDNFREHISTQNIAVFSKYLAQLETQTDAEHLAKVIALNNLAYYERNFGQLQNAISHYSQAWRIYGQNSLGGINILESCLKPLGNLYTQTNALEEAQKTIEQYLLLARKTKNKPAIIGGITNLSVVYYSGGKFAQAIQILEEGRTIAPNNPDVWMNLASNQFATGAFSQAAQSVEKSLRLLPDQPNGYKLLAQLFIQKKKYNDAETAILRALSLLKNHSETRARELAKTYLSLAEIQYRQALTKDRDSSEALASLKKGYLLLIPQFSDDQQYPTNRQLYAENTLMDLLDLHGQILADLENYNQAFDVLELAFNVSELIAMDLVSQESQLTLYASARKRSEFYLSVLASLIKTHPTSELVETAFQVIERSKYRVVHQAHAKQQVLQNDTNDTLKNKLQSLKHQLASVQEELFRVKQQLPQQSDRYAALLEAYQHNILRTRTLNSEVYQSFQYTNPSDPISLSQLQEQLSQDEATFLHYFVGKQNSYLIQIDSSQISFHVLTLEAEGQGQLINTYKNYISYFESSRVINNDPLGYIQTANTLYELLQIPEADHLIISPDGVLNFVPFGTLLSKPSKSMQYEQMPFLVNTSHISYTLSVQRYGDGGNAFSADSSALGVFPVFEGTDLELTYSLEEANALASAFDTELLMRKEAVVDSAFAKAYRHTLLHFSTHATGGSFTQPATLTLYDTEIPVNRFYGASFRPDLVVLSACETGVGKLIAGEGAQSLARGFQYAGASNVLFSLWRVNDRSTATLMENYYHTLKKTESRDNSLTIAQRNYLKNADVVNAQKSPYYWGAFVYYGSIDSASKNHSIKWILGATFLLFLIFLIFKYGFTTRVFTR